MSSLSVSRCHSFKFVSKIAISSQRLVVSRGNLIYQKIALLQVSDNVGKIRNL